MKITTILIAAVLLGGCSNLQTYNNDNRRYVNVVPPSPKSPVLKNCPLYITPKPIPTPAAPVAEFEAMKSNQHLKREKLLLDYIQQLRLHISAVSKANDDAYAKYIAVCTSE